MHIHIHEFTTGPFPDITQDEWHDIAAEVGETTGHVVTFGASVEEYQAVAGQVEILIASPYTLRKLDLFAAPRLLAIQSTSAGVDSLGDFSTLPAHVMLLNNRGVHGPRAGEYAIMALLMLQARLPYFATLQRAAHWHRLQTGVITGKHLTIIGLGSLGGAAAFRARQFGLRVTGLRTSAAPHEHCDIVLPIERLDEVLPTTDFLFLACPLTAQTRNILSRARIALLPAHAGVINIGRGGLIDQTALCDALNAEAIAGAVLDVFAQEPIPPSDPIWQTKNLTITPHISSDDPASYNRDTLRIFFKNLSALQAGSTPPTLVDRTRGY